MYKILFLIIPIFLLTSCGRDQIETYDVPKSTHKTAEMQASPRPQPVASEFTATLPEGWTQSAGTGMRKANWSIAGTSIEFYLISLRMGDVTSNVNRWRGQVGLAAASAEEIAKTVETFSVDGHAVNYTELYNEELGRGIIVGIVDLAPAYWYFTAKGPVEALQAHAADIRKFIASVQLGPTL